MKNVDLSPSSLFKKIEQNSFVEESSFNPRFAFPLDEAVSGASEVDMEGCDLRVTGYGAMLSVFEKHSGTEVILEINTEILKRIAAGPEAEQTLQEEEDDDFSPSPYTLALHGFTASESRARQSVR